MLEWHQRSGLVLLGLVVFRMGWGLWGGRYARLTHYWTTPRAFVDHFLRRGEPKAHTSPGVALAVVLVLAVAVQVGTGLFATDDIFNEGPLNRYVSNEFARTATWIHHRVHWLVLGAGVVHLTAHAVYGLMLRDPTPLAMFTGRKRLDLPPTPHFWIRAAVTTAPRAGRRANGDVRPETVLGMQIQLLASLNLAAHPCAALGKVFNQTFPREPRAIPPGSRRGTPCTPDRCLGIRRRSGRCHRDSTAVLKAAVASLKATSLLWKSSGFSQMASRASPPLELSGNNVGVISARSAMAPAWIAR